MNTHLSRRGLVVALAALPLASLAQPAKKVLVEVWKDPDCGCCQAWVQHLQDNGFAVKVTHGGNDAMRAKLGMPQKLASCHTALAGGYALEGHVPAREIRRLLKERPQAVGLTVPGMVVGSPGMDGSEYGGRRDAYDVLLVTRAGDARIYASYPRS